MSSFGTDIVALACIVGGAATSGAVTLAFLDGNHEADAPCAVEAMAVAPRIVVSGSGGSETIVMATPNIRFHSSADCGAWHPEHIQIRTMHKRRDMADARVFIETARAGAERARERAEVVRMRIREAQEVSAEARENFERVRSEMEAARATIEAAELESLAERLKEAQVRVEVVKKGSGGQMD